MMITVAVVVVVVVAVVVVIVTTEYSWKQYGISGSFAQRRKNTSAKNDCHPPTNSSNKRFRFDDSCTFIEIQEATNNGMRQ